ncbi:MAG: DUF6785 family protein [Chthonomonadales bacterium]
MLEDPLVGVDRPRGTGPSPAASWVRPLIVCALLMPINAIWLAQMEMGTNQSRGGVPSGPYPTTFSLFANVICFMAALSVGNGLLQRRRPRWALRHTELLLVYIALTIGSCVLSVDFLDVLFPMLGHPVHYATPANNWNALFIRYLPRWFTVTDPAALTPWYTGHAHPYTWSHLRAWALPLAAWGGFILLLLGTMLCINLILRRQWTQYERLSYPIIQLPMEMTDPAGGFYRHKLLWLGAGVAGGISLLNGLAMFFPSLPTIPVKYFDLSPYASTPPWNAIGWTPVSLYPFAIGLGFLLPTDLLFSSWFFYFLWKGQRVLASYLGWSAYSPEFPYINEQCFGAYMGIAILAVWMSRRYLVSVLRFALHPQSSSRQDARQMRLPILGAMAGFFGLVLFFHAAGLSIWVCVAAFAIYLATALAITRMRAELGPPAHDLHNGGPDYVLTMALGTRAFSAQELSILTYFYWFNRAYRSLAMPAQLEAFKIGERKAIPPRTVAVTLTLASVAGILTGYWALYTLGYVRGAEARMAPHFTGFGWEAFNRLASWISVPRGRDAAAMAAIGIGGSATLALHILRMRFTWWPLHPLGLAVSGSWSMNTIWLPMLIAWVCKVCVLRYGGLRSYRTALSFFYGLILGDYLTGCAWPIVGWLLGTTTYSFQQ